MTPAQCRAARAMVEMHIVDLAESAGVAHTTISDFENGTRKPRVSSVDKIRTALETAGVVFLDQNGNGPGVALSRPVPNQTGQDGDI